MSSYPPPFQDLATLAEHICCGESTIENWVRLGLFPVPKKIGGKRLLEWRSCSVTLPDMTRLVQHRSTSKRRPFAMQRGPRRRIPTIKRGTFAEVIRAYKSSPKFDALARSTRVSYGHLLNLAERPCSRTSIPRRLCRSAGATEMRANRPQSRREMGAGAGYAALPYHGGHTSAGWHWRACALDRGASCTGRDPC
jgi:hypothetical protein